MRFGSIPSTLAVLVSVVSAWKFTAYPNADYTGTPIVDESFDTTRCVDIRGKVSS